MTYRELLREAYWQCFEDPTSTSRSILRAIAAMQVVKRSSEGACQKWIGQLVSDSEKLWDNHRKPECDKIYKMCKTKLLQETG